MAVPTKTTNYPRINIYLDDPQLHTQVKIAAARRGVTISAYCLEAIRRLLVEERFVEEGLQGEQAGQHLSPQEAAEALDRLRRKIGPIDMPVSELIREGR